MKYAWIQSHRDSFAIAMMCRVLQVSKSGYYKWLGSEPSPRSQRSSRIRQAVKQIYEDSFQVYGSYKISSQLSQNPSLESACRNTVAGAMQEMGLKSRVFRKFKPTTTVTDRSKVPAPNLLNQMFSADGPNQKWVTDITYLPTAAEWVYLAVVLDLFSRKVIGWSLSDSLASPLISNALRKAIESRRPQGNQLLHHSDRGCQYTSEAYQEALRMMNITCSMSRTGCCYDNAVMERFFWSLKHEWTKFESFAAIEDARLSVFQYIEAFYNQQRIHQTLGYKSPNRFEAEHEAELAA